MPIENRNLNQGNQTNRPVPQADLHLRSSRGCGREITLSAAGWSGIQEPFSCRDGHHRAFLRRMGILERGNGRECNCTECRESRSYSCGRNQSDCGAGCRACAVACQDRPQENRRISGAESEGRAGRSDPLVLPGLRQELHRIGSRDTRDLSGKASGQLTLPEKRITCEQAPIIGSLPCFADVTNLFFVSRGDPW